MKSPISDKIKGGDIKIKRKKKSPLSDKYRQFLNHENIELKPSKKKKKTKLEDIQINVIKKEDKPKVEKVEKKINKSNKLKLKGGGSKGKTPSKRKRVRVKNRVPKQKDGGHNKKCGEKSEKPMKKNKKSRRLSKRHTRGRKISLKSPSSKKENIKQAMDNAKNMSDDKIKKELMDNGIIIKGNQKKLMRDIYVFSNLEGINIRKE